MEDELARLISGLKPETEIMSFASEDKWFQQILGMAATQGLLSEVEKITFEVQTHYEFDSLKNFSRGGFVAVFLPRFYIILIEDGKRNDFTVRNPRYYNDLVEITEKPIVETDIPDVEEVGVCTLDFFCNTLEKGKIWRLSK